MSRSGVVILSTLAAFASTGAMAAPKGASPPSSGRTIVKFDGDTIDGTLMRPDGDLMAGRPDIPMPSLVQPPRSFQRAAHQTLLVAAGSVEKTTVKPVATPTTTAQPMKDGGTAGNREGADGGHGDRSSSGTR
jgi:hypothetical protein